MPGNPSALYMLTCLRNYEVNVIITQMKKKSYREIKEFFHGHTAKMFQIYSE